jgi:hypothetical protein
MIFCHCTVCNKDFVRPRNRGNLTVCSPCLNKARTRDWKRAHPERVKLHRGHSGTNEQKLRYAHSERGREKARGKSTRWYRNNLEKARAQNRAANARRYAKNSEPFKMAATNRRIHIKRATPSWVDLTAIAKIYSDAHQRGLEVDHIVPVRGRDVSGLHVPWNLRAVTREENRAKRNYLIPALVGGNA